jgi:multidrug transporter EmrE-like cation transporter
MTPEDRKLRRTLLIICMAVYLAGMGLVIEVARGSPLRAITEVRYALCAYCGIALTCLVSMVLFSRRITAAARGPTAAGPPAAGAGPH